MDVDMFLKKIFSYIGTQRASLMGLAMIAVFLTHAPSQKLGFEPSGLLGLICSYGFWGVDVFFFLSAFGLCYSIKKNSLRVFYINRILRIIPAWIIVLFGVHVVGLFIDGRIPSLEFNYPHTISDLFGWYTGIGFYLNTCSYEWYVPTILLFYCIAPILFYCSDKSIVLIWLFALILYVANHSCEILPHLDIFFERLPVFILGFIFFRYFIRNQIIRFLLLNVAFIIVITCLVYFELCSTTILFGVLLPEVLAVAGWALSQNMVNIIRTVLTFIGSVSLEFYLIHLYRRPQYLFSLFVNNGSTQVVLAFITCLLGAYVLHIFVEFIVKGKYLASRRIKTQ